MQNNNGLHSLLKLPSVYTLFQELCGAHAWRRKFIREVIRPRPGDKIVDVGCGPAQMLAWLPAECAYVGLDISEAYIESAKRKYGARGVFLVGNTATMKEICVRGGGGADVVFCAGVLHHLDDAEVRGVLQFAHRQLVAGGRFCALEAAWLPGQSRLSRWMVGQDRGKNIRTPDEYRALAEQVFPSVHIIPDLHPLRIPYAGLTMECLKEA
ncbi:MAG: methyltransferase domain-containing protein [Opitutaceae bacterium]|jgi:ubiquinone/menaquinone biosynthesis C-methylase UbiE|nr:methyltransferase domain-containing protein [Opitutaceae bacterium]